MVIVSTLVSPDGVIGLNGKQYLLDDGDELLKFDTVAEAREFIEEAGEDPDNEYIEYEDYEESEFVRGEKDNA